MRRQLAIALTLAASILITAPAAASPEGSGPAALASAPVTFALLGDTPYGGDQRVVFPELVDAINADPKVRFVLHAGDVKNGSSTCDDARFADLAALYGTFADPFVLTPGDNEWTDSPHRGRWLSAHRAPGGRTRCLLPGSGMDAGRAPHAGADPGLRFAARGIYGEHPVHP